MFVVLTGPDGCGKGTQLELLTKRVPNNVSMHFPAYNTPTGQLILAFLKGEASVESLTYNDVSQTYGKTTDNEGTARALQALFTANRLEKVPFIQDTLHSGKHLFFDRYDVEAIVYGTADGLEKDWCEALQFTLPPPDLYILLDIPVSVSMLRRPERRDRYEKDIAFMEKVRKGYLDLFQERANDPYSKYLIINGDDTVESIHEQIYEAVTDRTVQLSLPLSIVP